MEIGRTALNNAIHAVRFGTGDRVLVFVGGLHAGFAPATVTVAENLIAYLTENLANIPDATVIYVIPTVNIDSRAAPGTLAGRLNANGVDLNRNADCRWVRDARFRGDVVAGSGGSAPFSEPETRALADFITGLTPQAVIFWEARYTDGLASPGRCGGRSRVSYELASVYGRAAGYAVDDFEIDTGQITNGDFSNWLDLIDIPAAAVLLPDYDSADWTRNLAGILAVMDTFGR